MTNPKSDHILVALGIGGEPKPGGPPNSVRSRPGVPDSPMPGDTGKASREAACFVPADKRCGECSNWHHDTRICDKVEGTMNSGDGCDKFFQPVGGGNMPSASPMIPSGEV